MRTLKVGTRRSQLALWQTEWVKAQVERSFPQLEVEVVTLDTKGDLDLATPLPSVADKGFFTVEIEQALLAREVDVAVHSLKDLPTVLPAGLRIGAYGSRADAHDVFLSRDGTPLARLPEGARVGTSSLRRTAQIKRLRPDLACVELRGNLNTRWRKLQEGHAAGIVLAAAGVERLGWQDRVTEAFPFDVMLPAPGQGVIAVECAEDRPEVLEVLRCVNHEASERAARAERAFLGALEGGCQTPLGAHATCARGAITLDAAVFGLDGERCVRVSVSGPDPEDVGAQAARAALRRGADEIMRDVRAM
ncbi:hydroxymethylbilane synthase [Adlercreutzia sp. ZJ242]|uniref:hydroxymethylbilane synthase n=1 Tax=Adlercreutzia sp. ZJ242 TaxID=2709409 RepID=UPI0013EBE4B5|nr:hydroxymethylbilane synthase [Adlercreutzia sp. ZJ242]